MIYCVEDDAGIREMMLYTLGATGFEATGFSNGKDLKQALDKEVPQMVLLDIMLPGEDGLSLLRYIRNHSRTKEVPVIMCTAKSTEMDAISGLEMGADDYLKKPFGMMEMVSRIKAILRRVQGQSDEEVLSLGPITLHVRKHQVLVEDKEIELTKKEYELLKVMMSHPGIVYTRDQLLNQVWGDTFMGETRTVDVHVNTLRNKLKSGGNRIETIRGVGYRMEEIDE